MVIFKKVKNKIKEVNWFSYLIELIIVILGISIAFFFNSKKENLSMNNKIMWIEKSIHNEAYDGVELVKDESMWIETITKELDSLIQLINNNKHDNSKKIYELTEQNLVYANYVDDFLIKYISESNSTSIMDVELLELYFSYYNNERLIKLIEDDIVQSYNESYENILFNFNNDTTLVLNNNQRHKYVKKLLKIKLRLTAMNSLNRDRNKFSNELIDWLKVNRRNLIRKHEEE